ncbi:MAG: hypothetical protein PHX13_01720 [Thiovulaceae bacterium]|nr:hypothetical protein [Sulfurimonadaceae bacterium]
MKFIASKKLSDNQSLRLVMIWMIVALIITLGLNIIVKSIDYGTSPQQWVDTLLGNTEKFIDPMTINDLLLRVHTDLFTLILIYILIGSLYIRTSHPKSLKLGLLSISLITLILYPIMLIVSVLYSGAFAVEIAGVSFILFNLIMLIESIWLLIMLIRGKL